MYGSWVCMYCSIVFFLVQWNPTVTVSSHWLQEVVLLHAQGACLTDKVTASTCYIAHAVYGEELLQLFKYQSCANRELCIQERCTCVSYLIKYRYHNMFGMSHCPGFTACVCLCMLAANFVWSGFSCWATQRVLDEGACLQTFVTLVVSTPSPSLLFMHMPRCHRSELWTPRKPCPGEHRIHFNWIWC